jgi:L-alanine-DL-glutamate epimerase-like enolase superfamily enzyme
MLQLHYKKVRHAFEYPFTISKGTKTHQEALVIALGMGPYWGFGEACKINYYGIDLDAMISLLESKKQVIQKYALTDPERFWHFLHHLFPNQHFLIAALDCAGWDLFAKMRQKKVYQLIGVEQLHALSTNYTIGLAEPAEMLEKMKAHPWPIYKVKISNANDIDTLALLRANTKSLIRIDANEALDVTTTLKLLPEFEKLAIELIEQPIAKDNYEGMQELKAKSSIPFYADEACVTENDVIRCKNAFHGITIKLSKCGGITPALRMIKEARSLGMSIMLGNMNECSIGTAALVHLQHLVDKMDADGPLLLKEDSGKGLFYEHAIACVEDKNGLGIQAL